ncbi:MAG: hypothetical protein ACLFVO_21300 [Chloroflexaceae bacterium]
MQRLLILILLFSSIALLPASPTQAQTGPRYFPETGFSIAGPIREYWERNGGLEVFGYPISPQQTETVEGNWTGPVQWFERDRLEDHSNEGLGVLAGRLGARELERWNWPWREFPQVNGAPAGCRYFPETGHSLCEPFLSYWERNGGLERFGYPLTEPFSEKFGDWRGTVQYFERRRMEHHPELRGTRYEVLLGLLGKELREGYSPCWVPIQPELRRTYLQIPFREELGCFDLGSSVYSRDRPAATQTFQNGLMFWMMVRSHGVVHAFTFDPPRHYRYGENWNEGDPNPDATAPPGLYVPQRGFGQVWSTHPDLRQTLGFATEPEQPRQATMYQFANGVLIWVQDTDMVYVAGPDADDIYIVPRAQ